MNPAPGGSRVRKLILDKVRLLGPTEHKEIFSLLQAHGIAFSSNSNGVFINLSTVPDDVLATVKAFVDYCAMNKTGLDEYEKRLQECKITHRFDIISSLATSLPTPLASPLPSATAMPPLLATTPPVKLTSPVVGRSPLVPRCSYTSASTMNSLPSVLINGRFQATKKKFSRRKIVDRKHGLTAVEATDPYVLAPEAYTYVRLTAQTTVH